MGGEYRAKPDYSLKSDSNAWEPEFDPKSVAHCFVETYLPLLQIQEQPLSVTCERMGTNYL